MPVCETTPNGTARPCACVARSTSPRRLPPPARTRRRSASTSTSRSSRQVDDDRAVADRVAGDAVAAAAHGDGKLVLAREADGLDDVGRPGAADDRAPAGGRSCRSRRCAPRRSPGRRVGSRSRSSRASSAATSSSESGDLAPVEGLHRLRHGGLLRWSRRWSDALRRRQGGEPNLAGAAATMAAPMRRYFVTTFGCQMNAHDSERIKGTLESIGFGEAASPRGGRRARLQHVHDPREARPALRRAHGRREGAEAAEPGRDRRRRRLLRRGAARAPVRALPVRRRRLRPGHDPAPRRLDRRRRRGRRARRVRDRRGALVLGRAAAPARAPLPGLGAGLDGLQLEVRLLHRPVRARPRGEPAAGRDRRRGHAARRRRRARGHAARPERQLVGPRPAPRPADGVRRAAARLRRRRRDRAHPLHEPAPEGLPRARDRGDGRVPRPSASTSTCRSSRARRAILKAMRRTYDAERYLRLVDRLRAAIPDLALGHRHHRRLPRRDRGGLRGDARASSRPCATTAPSRSSTRRAAAPRRPRCPTRCPRR